MPAVAIVTLVAVGLLVAVLAAYLIRVAFILRQVVRRLRTILSSVTAVIEESAPLDEVIDEVNRDLDAVRNALEHTAGMFEIGTGSPSSSGRPSPSGSVREAPSRWARWRR